ncbi:cerebellin 20 [Centroberyx gerrardi]|uniref:cerebellin 20 n=1 Tax=Centroberyx gerrardi TaxID=166262 RepID=UPI003AAE6CCF
MRAITFLCLLGATVAQYDWNGGQGTTAPHNGNSGNVCLTDSASCGCCLMQKQMYRMEAFFNLSLNVLEQDLERTAMALNNVRDSRSAFSVSLGSINKHICTNISREKTIIVYKHVFINLGGSYNTDTGIFTVSRSGVYAFALTVYSDAGSPGNSLDACASLTVNGMVVAGPSDRNLEDQEDSATVVLAQRLQAGDKVAVELPPGCYLCDNKAHYNTFTGFLLYATK